MVVNTEVVQTPPKRREFSFPVTLILIGLVFLVGKIFTAFNLPWLWPAILLALGFVLVIAGLLSKEGGPGRWFSPLLLFIFGLVYLLTTLGVFIIDMNWVWPAFLVIVGIAMLLREQR
jgi:uncharacterized membrane protein